MSVAKPCYLLYEGDDPANASFCETFSDAMGQFARYGRTAVRSQGAEVYNMRAYVYFVDAQGDDFDPGTPDRRLALTERYCVKWENL